MRPCAARSAALAGWKPRAAPASPPGPALNMSALALSTRCDKNTGAFRSNTGAFRPHGRFPAKQARFQPGEPTSAKSSGSSVDMARAATHWVRPFLITAAAFQVRQPVHTAPSTPLHANSSPTTNSPIHTAPFTPPKGTSDRSLSRRPRSRCERCAPPITPRFSPPITTNSHPSAHLPSH